MHDFLIKERGKAVPYGVYDITRNEGWVSVGIDHDTASFAVHTIRRWWQRMGRSAYPDTTALLITADAGGSNGSRVRLWKWELQQFANRTGLTITVCHFPPGTSKWNKIEHRLFSHIAMNWRGKPLVDLVTIISLIGDTTTEEAYACGRKSTPAAIRTAWSFATSRWRRFSWSPIRFTATGTTPFAPRRKKHGKPQRHHLAHGQAENVAMRCRGEQLAQSQAHLEPDEPVLHGENHQPRHEDAGGDADREDDVPPRVTRAHVPGVPCRDDHVQQDDGRRHKVEQRGPGGVVLETLGLAGHDDLV